MTISIEIFRIFDTIRDKHGIGITQWAEHSRMPQPRISELRKLARDNSSSIGRAFSFEKCLAIVDGLRSILGGEILSKELLESVECLKNYRDRNVVLVLALDEEKQPALELYIKTLMKAKPDVPKRK